MRHRFTPKCPARRRAVVSGSAAVALSLAFVCAPAAQSEQLTGVIGLLALPPLAGRADCAPPARREAPLHATPDSPEVVGWIRSDKGTDSDAACYQVVLRVYRRDGRVSELPTAEYEEEEPDAAVVLEARGRWFKLRLTDGTERIRGPRLCARGPERTARRLANRDRRSMAADRDVEPYDL